MAGGETVFLASDATAFQQTYGFAPLGVFSRNLSNSDQLLTLLDAFGNEIDRVHYRDDAPWPDADGNGRYLRLISVDLDNSLASSWEAVGSPLVGMDEVDLSANRITVFPNPAGARLRVTATEVMDVLELTDLQGRVFYRGEHVGTETEVDLMDWPSGCYLLKAGVKDGVLFKVVVKR